MTKMWQDSVKMWPRFDDDDVGDVDADGDGGVDDKHDKDKDDKDKGQCEEEEVTQVGGMRLSRWGSCSCFLTTSPSSSSSSLSFDHLHQKVNICLWMAFLPKSKLDSYSWDDPTPPPPLGGKGALW